MLKEIQVLLWSVLSAGVVGSWSLRSLARERCGARIKKYRSKMDDGGRTWAMCIRIIASRFFFPMNEYWLVTIVLGASISPNLF